MTNSERRRYRRRLWFWRIVALIAIVIVIAGFFGDDGPDGPYIARYELQGVIFDDPLRDDLMAEIADNEDIEALVLRINSPGGTTAGSEALYESLRRVAESKRVVAVLGEVAASGGYIAAISADHIVARGNTLTGSIGVIAQAPNVTGLMEMVGVSMEEVKSSPLKGQPSPFSEPTPEVIAAEEALVEDGYQWFRGLVGERRTLDDAALDVVADGRVFSGRQAVANGLVDQIGGETAAIAWLNEQGVESGLPVEDVFVEREDKGLFGFGDSWFLSQITGRARPSHGGLTLLSILK
jgi:protease-4